LIFIELTPLPFSAAELCPLGARLLKFNRRPLLYGLSFVFSTMYPLTIFLILSIRII